MTGTMTGAENSLRSLRDRPFELLKELEKRSRNVGAGSAPESPAGQEWVGVAFRMGGETFLVAREETREVLGYPAAVTRIPGAKSWVKGLANVRGQLLPMLDLRQFLGSGVDRPRAQHAASSWSITARFRRGSWSTRCWASGVSRNRNSTPSRRPP